MGIKLTDDQSRLLDASVLKCLGQLEKVKVEVDGSPLAKLIANLKAIREGLKGPPFVLEEAVVANSVLPPLKKMCERLLNMLGTTTPPSSVESSYLQKRLFLENLAGDLTTLQKTLQTLGVIKQVPMIPFAHSLEGGTVDLGKTVGALSARPPEKFLLRHLKKQPCSNRAAVVGSHAGNLTKLLAEFVTQKDVKKQFGNGQTAVLVDFAVKQEQREKEIKTQSLTNILLQYGICRPPSVSPQNNTGADKKTPPTHHPRH